jgi:hypothetical protein
MIEKRLGNKRIKERIKEKENEKKTKSRSLKGLKE